MARQDQMKLSEQLQQLAMIVVQLQAHVKPSHDFMQKMLGSVVMGNFEMKAPDTIDPLPVEPLKPMNFILHPYSDADKKAEK